MKKKPFPVIGLLIVWFVSFQVEAGPVAQVDGSNISEKEISIPAEHLAALFETKIGRKPNAVEKKELEQLKVECESQLLAAKVDLVVFANAKKELYPRLLPESELDKEYQLKKEEIRKALLKKKRKYLPLKKAFRHLEEHPGEIRKSYDVSGLDSVISFSFWEKNADNKGFREHTIKMIETVERELAEEKAPKSFREKLFLEKLNKHILKLASETDSETARDPEFEVKAFLEWRKRQIEKAKIEILDDRYKKCLDTLRQHSFQERPVGKIIDEFFRSKQEQK